MSGVSGVFYDRWFPKTGSEAGTFATSSVLLTASYLTDPVCKAREYFVRSRMLEDLPSASPRIVDFLQTIGKLPFCSFMSENSFAKVFEFYYLRVAAATFAILAPITAPVGVALRAIASQTRSQPLHYLGSFPPKELQGHTFSHLLRNICGITGGYDIEEGSQMPIRDDLNYSINNRLDRLIYQIQEADPDILCLNEVFDIKDAHYIANALKDRYAHFIFQCGPRAVGPNSGLFFASKFAISHIDFKPFPKEMLVDNAKQCEKGVLFVDLKDSQQEIVTVALTHGQHSDQVRHGSEEEKKARADELNFIYQHLAGKQRVLLTGDLNMDDEEMKASPNVDIYKQFHKTAKYINQQGKEEFSWGGDEWYVGFGNRTADSPTFPASSSQRLEPRKVSTGCNLDHTMVSKKTLSIVSRLIEDPIPFDPSKITRESLSDHRGLYSIITLKSAADSKFIDFFRRWVS